jgi:hypothetical protein
MKPVLGFRLAAGLFRECFLKNRERFGVIRFQTDNFSILRDGAILVTFVGERVAEIVVSQKVFWLQSDGVAVLGDGTVQVALFHESRAELKRNFGIVRVLTAGLPEFGDCIVQITLHSHGSLNLCNVRQPHPGWTMLPVKIF